LPGDVALLARERAKANVVGVDEVQGGENVDDVLAGGGALGDRDRRGDHGFVRHGAFHELHEKERGAVHVGVLA